MGASHDNQSQGISRIRRLISFFPDVCLEKLLLGGFIGLESEDDLVGDTGVVVPYPARGEEPLDHIPDAKPSTRQKK